MKEEQKIIPWIINQGINQACIIINSSARPSQLYNQCQNNYSQHKESIFTVLPAFYIVAFMVLYINYQRIRVTSVLKQVLAVACSSVV